jgi:hypothetical protein
MRTAVCFSGELRSIDKTYSHIKERILNRFGEYDIFYHTWSDDPDLSKISYIENDPFTKDIWIEDRKTFDEKTYATHKRPEVNVQGFLRQLHCLKMVNQLKCAEERSGNFIYDTVVRIRPDIQPINNTSLEKNVINWDMKNYIYTTDHDDHFGYNDRFYFSDSDNMNFLSNRIDHIDEYFNMGGLFHYEIFFKWCVWKKGLKTARSALEFVLLRTNGDISSELGSKITDFKFL